MLPKDSFKTKLQKGTTWLYMKTLKQVMFRGVVLALSLMVFISLTEGVGLLLLLPLMQLVGLNVGQGSMGQITGLTSYIFSFIGLTPTLVGVLVIYVVVISMNAVLGRWQTIRTFSIEYEFAAHLRKHLYRSITKTSWLFFIRTRASDFTHALTYEIERVSNGTYQFLTMISTAMVLSVYIIFTLRIYGPLTILILFVGIVLIIVLKRKANSSRSTGEELSYTSKDMYSSIIQHIDGMKTIKSFGMEEGNVHEFSKITDQVTLKYNNTVQSYADVRALFNIGSVVFLSIIVVAMVEVMKVSIAGVLLLIFLFVRMVPMFSSIQQSYQYFINMLPAFCTILNLEKQCKDAAEPRKLNNEVYNSNQEIPVDLNEGIKLQNVSFSYDNDTSIIKDMNLTIKAGETTAIAGRSGAGKSTVADMVMGLIQPDKGKILLDGEKLNNIVSWRSQIGYVAQETFLFNDTVRSNMLIANQEADERDIEDALKLAASYEFVSNLPSGLDTIMGDRGVKLSGGERQRIALARALLRKPSLLILDEATSNLDSENEKKIMDAVDGMHGNMTILIIAHRLSTIRRADTIYLLEDGSVIESGTWNTLISENGKFEAFCRLQNVL